MATTYLSLGSNLGDKHANLSQAITLIQTQIGPLTAQSAFYATQPWGYTSPNTYLNACIAVTTTLTPRQLLRATQQIERQLHRTHKTIHNQYHDRTIDIDILLYDQLILTTPTLTIPHPHLTRRLFVLQPLADIAPSLLIPTTHLTVAQHLEKMKNEMM